MVIRGAQIDPTLCFLTTFSLYALLRHLLLGPAWGWYFVGGFAAGLGVFTKGVGFLPVLLLIPFFSLRGFRWQGLAGHRRGQGRLALVARAARDAAGRLPVVRAHAAGGGRERFGRIRAYRDEILFKQTVGRYAASWHHVKGWYYFIVEVIPPLWLPWSLLLFWLVPRFKAAYPRTRRARVAAAVLGDPRARVLLAEPRQARRLHHCRRCPRWRSRRCRSSNRCWRAPACGAPGLVLGVDVLRRGGGVRHRLRDAREVRGRGARRSQARRRHDAVYVYLCVVRRRARLRLRARAARRLAGRDRFARHRVLVFHRAGDEWRTLGKGLHPRGAGAGEARRSSSRWSRTRSSSCCTSTGPTVNFGHRRWLEGPQESYDAAAWLNAAPDRVLLVPDPTVKPSTASCFIGSVERAGTQFGRRVVPGARAGGAARVPQKGDASTRHSYTSMRRET